MTTPARHRRARQRPIRAIFAALAAGVTAVAVLGGLGVVPSAASLHQASGGDAESPTLRPAAYDGVGEPSADASPTQESQTQESPTQESPTQESPTQESPTQESPVETSIEEALPVDSGQGRRIVFSEGRQRVWLVSGRQRVKRTYPVSGSIYDNLDPGSYEVFSRSEDAWGIDDSGTMHYFVRFAQGERAAIGFHDIPVADGSPVQTVAQLGTPQSHGCIRQRRTDARALWRFAPVGTTVVVTA